MPVLVTGGSGFIGSYVVRELLRGGAEVTVFDRNGIGILDQLLEDSVAKVQLVTGDVVDLPALAGIVRERGINRVIHLAGELHLRSAENPWQCVQSNVIGTINVLELARMYPIERIVTASSPGLFGTVAQHPASVADDAPRYPGDIYEAAKAFGEDAGATYARQFGVSNVAIRAGMAYGPGCRIGWGRRLIEALAIRPLRGEPSELPWGDDQLNWSHVEDIARAFVVASTMSDTGVPAYNVRGDLRTMRDAARIANDLIPGARVGVEPGRHRWTQDFDDSLFREHSGWEPSWTLEAGIADLVEHTRRQLDAA